MIYYITLSGFFDALIMTWAFTVACLVARDFTLTPQFLPVLLSIAMVYGGGNILSTVCKKRLHNRTYLHTADFRRESTLAIVFLSTALLFSLAGGVNYFISMVILVLLANFQARNTKSLGLLRNLISACAGSCVFLMAMQYTGQVGINLFLFSMFLFFVMAREILRDIDDIQSDMESGILTLPLHYGIPRTIIAADIFMAAGISLAFALYSLGNFKPLFLGVSCVMLLAFALLYRYQQSLSISLFRQAIGWIMVFFLAGILVSSLR